MELFGFATREEKKLYEKLRSVSGIGPRTALNMLSSMTVRDLSIAIVTGDVNAISRALESRDMALDEARRELERLSRPAAARVGLSAAAGGGSAAMFALMFLGDGFDMLAAGLISAAVQAVLCFLPDQEGMPLTCLIGGFLVAALSLAVVLLCGMGDADRIILSNMMPLLPGLAFTNAIRDSMHGDMVSGGARICDAVMRAVILATGAGIAMLAFLRIGGGNAWWM